MKDVESIDKTLVQPEPEKLEIARRMKKAFKEDKVIIPV